MGFFQLKSLSRAKYSICTSGVHDCYSRCFVGLSASLLGKEKIYEIDMYHKRLSWLCFFGQGRKRATLLSTIRE
jgi:hypothetical protein